MPRKLIERLPLVRGTYREDYDLSKVIWFQAGGKAEILFRPADSNDLNHFLENKPSDIPVTIVGVGSNLIIRDGGVKGVVIKLGGAFAEIKATGKIIEAGAGALSFNVAKFAQQNGISGMEFLNGIPGSIGGAMAMNAGSYGSEIKDIFISAQAVDEKGEIHNLSASDMGFRYRGTKIPKSWIMVKGVFKGKKDNPENILKRMEEIATKREQSQPIRSKTGGSTFANPDPAISGGKKAWQLIDEAGCRGLQIGGAKISEKHCNFMINTGNATANDLETLGEEVRKRVKEKSNVDLRWEIRIIGDIIKNKD